LTGCWLALTLIVPAVFVWIAYEHRADLATRVSPLADLQAALRAEIGIRAAKVTMGRTVTTSATNGTSTTDYLQVDAQPNSGQTSLDAVVLRIAGAVLNRDPDLLGKQVLVVRAQRGFDLGIASWSYAHQEAHSGGAWRERLRQGAHASGS
jgi:hypothetical protein